MLTHLDLFSGIGGFALAAQMVGGIETRQFVEIEPYCQKVLNKNFPGVPVHGNIRTFSAQPGDFDLVTGGFPCQDLSAANPNGGGLDGDRSGLFFELMRVVCECRPRYVALENVAALLSSNNGRDMGAVFWELAQSGYAAEWDVIPAALIGANHLRERIWIVAYANSNGRQRANRISCNNNKNGQRSPRCPQWKAVVPATDTGFTSSFPPRIGGISTVSRMDDGLPEGLDKVRRQQIKALGNAVVPQVAAIALQRVKSLNKIAEFPIPL